MNLIIYQHCVHLSAIKQVLWDAKVVVVHVKSAQQKNPSISQHCATLITFLYNLEAEVTLSCKMGLEVM